MWAALRHAELMQLMMVHLWLCGDYLWSDSRGLAAVLAPEQLALLREAKLVPPQQLQRQLQQATSSSSSSAGGVSAPDDSPTATGTAAPGLALGANSVQISLAQRAVWSSLQQVPGVLSAQLEASTADQLFTVDVLVKTDTGRQIAVEFDGPYHYAIAVPSVAAAPPGQEQQQQQEEEEQEGGVGAYKDRFAVQHTSSIGEAQQQQQQQPLEPRLVPVRRVLLRNKALAARGLEVLCVPYFEWSQHQSKPQRRRYLARLLQQSGS
jgi:hypothetical protein